MTQNIINLLKAQNARPLSARSIANSLHAAIPAVVTELLALRKGGRAKSWGSGTPYMFYWSV
jgi:hypothetical protein